MEIKITWEEYKKFAFSYMQQKYPNLIEGSEKFMKSHTYEPDSEVYEIPEYIEFKVDTRKS